MRMSNAKKLLKWEGVGLWNLTLVIEARKGTLTSLGPWWQAATSTRRSNATATFPLTSASVLRWPSRVRMRHLMPRDFDVVRAGFSVQDVR